MAAYNINGRCEDCKFADIYGRSCKHGLMYPLSVLINYGDIYKCPKFERKSNEQLAERNKQNE